MTDGSWYASPRMASTFASKLRSSANTATSQVTASIPRYRHSAASSSPTRLRCRSSGGAGRLAERAATFFAGSSGYLSKDEDLVRQRLAGIERLDSLLTLPAGRPTVGFTTEKHTPLRYFPTRDRLHDPLEVLARKLLRCTENRPESCVELAQSLESRARRHLTSLSRPISASESASVLTTSSCIEHSFHASSQYNKCVQIYRMVV